ncbi:MAG: M48 family metalloprotease [Candidatus Hodarchaeota archaeon]
MPANLYLRSLGVIIFLWSIVFALGMAISYIISFYYGEVLPPSMIILLPVIVAFLVVGIQFIVSPWIMDLMIGWIFNATKYNVNDLPPHIRDFLYNHMQSHNFSLKYVVIIHDNNPNAFTFGHTKKNARMAITEGILKYLNEEEQLAVVAHECGHIIHRDFIWMTVAAAIPLICYSFYQGLWTLARTRSSSDDEAGKVGFIALVLAIISWIVYLLSHFVVLILSRIREYYADKHSAGATGQPGALSRALVKIAYGIIQAEAQRSEIMADKDRYSVAARRRAARQAGFIQGVSPLGIFDIKTARSLSNSGFGRGITDLDEDTIIKAASWDLSNPWGSFLEKFSTHPLPAKRIRAMNELQVQYHQQPEFPRLGKVTLPESLWDEFFVDIFLIYIAPWLVIILPVIGGYLAVLRGYNPLIGAGLGFLIFAVVWKWRRHEKYPKIRDSDPVNTVVQCLTDMTKNSYYEASPLRGKSAVFEGRLVGRGTPGYLFSEDLVLQDDTGIITLDYSPLLAFMSWFFAIFKVPKLMGKRVKVYGWYHRVPGPVLSVWKIVTPEGKTFKNRWSGLNWFIMWLFILLGLVLIAVGVGEVTISDLGITSFLP